MPVKTFLFTCLFVCMAIVTSSQILLTDTTNFRFINTNTKPAEGWKQKDFDDSGWQQARGTQFVAYDENANTLSRDVKTIYARSYFNLGKIENHKDVYMYCDFDDGFAAYVNGVELARVNLGKKGTSITHEQLADRSHEMRDFVKNTYDVVRYYMDSNFIAEHLVEGKNTLAIEVHNDSRNGNDLGLYVKVEDVTGLEYDVFRDRSRYKRCVQLDSTHLPIIIIETDEFGIQYKRIKTDATIGIISNSAGKYNLPEDEYNNHSGNISIEMRGESSSHYPKQSFDIELKTTMNEDTAVELLGMPKESDWILQGPFADKSQIRNALMYELARKTGRYAPRTEFCEVIMNGEYVGLYNLVEKIKRDKDRIDINKMHTDEISGESLTGGYILKYDKPRGKLEIAYPKEKNLQPEQEAYIMGHMEEYMNTLYSNIGLDSDLGYKKYIKPNSLLDYVIMAELGKNCDSYLYSTYLYKEKDKDGELGQIVYGPLWDFDLCFGNSVWQEGHQTHGWQFEYRSNSRFEIERLFQDKNLTEKFAERWFEYRQQFLHKDSLFNRIDELTTHLAEPINRNYEVWPVVHEGLYFPAYIVPTYEDEIIFVKNWLSERLEWIDSNIELIDYEVRVFETDVAENNFDSFKAKIYPNPIQNDFFIDLSMPKSGNLIVELINIQGQVSQVIENTFIDKGDYKVYWNSGNSSIEPGIYIVSIKVNGETYQHIKAVFE